MKIVISTDNLILDAKLEEEAKLKDLSIPAAALDILNLHFGISPLSLSTKEIEEKVFNEVAEYVKENVNKEFDLHMASETFRNIAFLQPNGKPSALRARLGRTFNSMVGTGRFSEVTKVINANGKVKCSVKNRAALYIVRK